MEDTKYNGWANRSTWLVNLHLNNTNEEVYNIATDILKNNSKDEAIRGLFQLLDKTDIKNEQEYYPDKINWEEVYQLNMED